MFNDVSKKKNMFNTNKHNREAVLSNHQQRTTGRSTLRHCSRGSSHPIPSGPPLQNVGHPIWSFSNAGQGGRWSLPPPHARISSLPGGTGGGSTDAWGSVDQYSPSLSHFGVPLAYTESVFSGEQYHQVLVASSDALQATAYGYSGGQPSG